MSSVKLRTVSVSRGEAPASQGTVLGKVSSEAPYMVNIDRRKVGRW